MVLEQRFFQLLRQASETAPVVRHCATAVGNEELQGRKVFEQVTRQALHKGGGVCIQIMRARGVEACIATGRDVHHGGYVVLHHFFVDGVPRFIAQRR